MQYASHNARTERPLAAVFWKSVWSQERLKNFREN